MCYVKKLVGFCNDGTEKKLGPDFNGQFDCARYDCSGCDHRLVDGESPKRNMGFRIHFRLDELCF